MNLKNKIVRVITSKSVINSGWIIGQQIFQMLIQLIVGVVTARYLGPSNYGALNYTASFVTFFSVIATLGMDGVIIKKLIEYPDDEGIYLGSSMRLRLVSSIFSTISVLVIVYILNRDDPMKQVLVFLQSFQLSFKAVQILDAWFQRHLQSKYVSIGKMLACIIVSAYKIFLLTASKDILWFAFSNSLTDGIIALVEYYYYKKNCGQKLKFSLKIGKEILGESYHFIISGLMVAIYGQMDKMMIGQMLSDISVGYYTTATAICGMWIFIPIAIINSFQPIIMETKRNQSRIKYLIRLEQLYSIIIWLCIGVSSMVTLLARPAVLILYGSDFVGAVEPLKIVIWYETFSMIGTARGVWVLCENKNRYVKYYLLMGTILNLILNTILISRFGVNGAAIATLITQIVTSVIAPLFFKETRIHTKLVIDAFLFKWHWGNEYK